MSVTWDPEAPSLHAEDCGCMRCESGFRPSAADRWRARDAHKRAQATLGALQKRPSRKELARAERRRLAAVEAERRQVEEREWRRKNPPMTEDEVRELEKLKAARFPNLAGGSRR